MHEVSKAINNLDPSKAAIDMAICGSGKWHYEQSSSNEKEGKCGSTINSSGSSDTSSYKQLSHMFTPPAGKETNHVYKDTKTNKMGEHTSATISKDISTNLNKDQKGVVSSAFAKAHEGAEIVEIRSISTTSVMVNACYDVLADGLPVSPYGCAEHNERLRRC